MKNVYMAKTIETRGYQAEYIIEAENEDAARDQILEGDAEPVSYLPAFVVDVDIQEILLSDAVVPVPALVTVYACDVTCPYCKESILFDRSMSGDYGDFTPGKLITCLRCTQESIIPEKIENIRRSA